MATAKCSCCPLGHRIGNYGICLECGQSFPEEYRHAEGVRVGDIKTEPHNLGFMARKFLADGVAYGYGATEQDAIKGLAFGEFLVGLPV